MAIDNLDPFAEKEDEFRTNDIKKSKSRLTRRRIDALKKSREAESGNQKTPFSKRAIKFFKELPEREDKKKTYLQLIFYTLLFISIATIIIFIISSWVTETVKQTQKEMEIVQESEANLTEIYKIVNGGADSDNSRIETIDNKIIELKELVNKNYDNPEAQYNYISALLIVCEEKKDVETIKEEAEKFLSNENVTFPTNAYFLINLKSAYLSLGESEAYIKTIEKLLSLPDDERYSFNADGFTEYKEKLRIELNKYKESLENEQNE